MVIMTIQETSIILTHSNATIPKFVFGVMPLNTALIGMISNANHRNVQAASGCDGCFELVI